MDMKKLKGIVFNGIVTENPTFRLVLGMCPTLAITTTVSNGLGMGLAATFVLICSNLVISLLRNFIPDKIRIPAFIVVIATFVTIVQLLLQGVYPRPVRIAGRVHTADSGQLHNIRARGIVREQEPAAGKRVRRTGHGTGLHAGDNAAFGDTRIVGFGDTPGHSGNARRLSADGDNYSSAGRLHNAGAAYGSHELAV